MSNEYIKIYGQLHSVETRHVLADASEIYDSTQGKTQDDINADLISELSRKAESSDIPDVASFITSSALTTALSTKSDKATTYSVPYQRCLVIPQSGMCGMLLYIRHDWYTAVYQPLFVITDDNDLRFHVIKTDSRRLPVDISIGSISGEDDDFVLAICNNVGPVTSIAIDILPISGTLPAISVVNISSVSDLSSFSDVYTLYNKPSSGIPASDLESSVQTNLGLAVSAAQSVDLQAIRDLIPASATSSNKLVDKSSMDDAIHTATATFKGVFNNWNSVPSISRDYSDSVAPDNNDYMVVLDAGDYASRLWSDEGNYVTGEIVNYNLAGNSYQLYKALSDITYSGQALSEPPSDTEHWEILLVNPAYEGTWRFKYAPSSSFYDKYYWKPEYQINRKPLTVAQLNAINSGITSDKVQIIDNISSMIPTVPEISTNILTDATSDTKTVSPKAVKTYADTKYTMPSSGIPASHLAAGVIPDTSGFVSESNLKTINNESIVGSGNINVGGVSIAVSGSKLVIT